MRTVLSESNTETFIQKLDILKGCEFLTLTDLQVELRSIKERIEKLYVEIETMKPITINEEQEAFHKITRLANR